MQIAAPQEVSLPDPAPPPSASSLQAEESCDLVIVGAGLAALHLAARLPESLAQVCSRRRRRRPRSPCRLRLAHLHALTPPAGALILAQNTVVIDPAGAWLTSWVARAARLAAPHMRAPATQHPHASPSALQAWAERQGRQQELVPVVKGFAPVPTTALFADFCRSKVVGKLPAALRAPRADRVARLEPLGCPGGAAGALGLGLGLGRDWAVSECGDIPLCNGGGWLTSRCSACLPASQAAACAWPAAPCSPRARWRGRPPTAAPCCPPGPGRWRRPARLALTASRNCRLASSLPTAWTLAAPPATAWRAGEWRWWAAA